MLVILPTLPFLFTLEEAMRFRFVHFKGASKTHPYTPSPNNLPPSCVGSIPIDKDHCFLTGQTEHPQLDLILHAYLDM